MADGGNNAQKTPLGQYLDAKVFTRVSNLLQLRSGRLPATLVKQTDGNGGDGKTGTVWMVNFETTGDYTLPQVALPVHGHEFARLPYKQGDKGFVSTADVDTTSMSNLNDQGMAANFGRPANLAALVWHPIGNTQFTPQIDPNAHETYGRDSGTITHDGTQKSVVRTHATDGTVISSGAPGNAQGASNADGPHMMRAHPDGTEIKTPGPHELTANNATLDKQGNETNQGDKTTRGNITSTSGNVSAPSGAVSGMAGNFATGSIGGMSMAGGIMSGLQAALNTVTGAISGVSATLSGALGAAVATFSATSAGTLTATSADTGASLSANVVRARQYALLPSYTVAQLLSALPPATTPAGARVFVTDVRPVSSGFGNALNSASGGGSNGLCATCDGTNWNTG